MIQQQKMEKAKSRSTRLIRGAILVLTPVLLAGLYILAVQVYGLFRYDQSYFSAEYQDVYYSPGTVAIDLEQA